MSAPAPPDGRALSVLRLCSVFMPPDHTLRGRGRGFDPIGGMQNHCFELSKSLDALGMTQLVITTRPPGTPFLQDVGDRAQVYRVGLPISRLRQLYCLPASRLARRMAPSVDLIHAHVGEDLATLPVAEWISARHDLPLVVTVHCSLRHTLQAIDTRTKFIKVIGSQIESRGLPRADAVIVLTPRLARHLGEEGLNPQRVYVIPPGVDPELFGREQPDPFPHVGHPRVVYLGRLARSKGIDVLLEAAARLADRNIQILLVGDGPERRAAEQTITRLGLRRWVRIVGFIAHERVPAVLRHADALVLPSRYEEFGSVLLEAMRAGTPVVATRSGGVPAIVSHEENGLLVPPGEPGALAAAINRVIADSGLARRLASAGRSRASEYTWAAVGAKVLGVYRDVLASGRDVAGRLEGSRVDSSGVVERTG